MSGPVTQRWEGFLTQVRERFQEVMRESQEGCAQLLEQAGYDPAPLANAWGAMEMRAKALETKVEETWGSQVERAFEEAGAPPQAIAYERAKGQGLREWMEVERERVRIAIYCDAARKLFQRTAADMAAAQKCLRCGVPLEVPFTFRALNVPCKHCNTMNGYEPGARIRMAEAFCVHPLCEEASWREWLVMKAAEKAQREARPTNIYVLKEWERTMIQYWRAYFTAKIRLLPETAQGFEADVRGKMRSFYDRMDREGAWVQAGRPRELA
jgi:hypothetical protein